MDVLQIVAGVIGAITVVASLLSLLTKAVRPRPIWIDETSEAAEREAALRQESINAVQAQMSDRYGKEQTKQAASVVWDYREVPLRDALKKDVARDLIFRHLSPAHNIVSENKPVDNPE